MTTLLELDDVKRAFGGVRAVDGVTATIDRGMIVGLIGPNGSGKTTLLNVVAAALKPTGGAVRFDGRDTRRWSAIDAARAGIGRAFQHPQTMEHLTLLENCMLGAMFGSRRLDKAAARKVAAEALERVGMVDQADAVGTGLSLAERKGLELARLLAMAPSLALADEIMAGLSTHEITAAEDALDELRARNVTVILVEHVPGVVARMADQVMVLREGRVLAYGDPDEVIANQEVVDAYLGGGRG